MNKMNRSIKNGFAALVFILIFMTETSFAVDYTVRDMQKSADANENLNIGYNITDNEQPLYVPGEIVDSSKKYYEAVKYALSNFEDKIVLTIKDYNKETYSLDVINEVLNDNPLLDYGYNECASNVLYCDFNEVTMTIEFSYNFTKIQMIEMRDASKKKADEIISKVIKPDMKDYEKEIALHDYLVNNAQYDERLFSGNVPYESYIDYGVLVKGTGVCSSYAKAMYRLLNSIGIQCLYVTGYANNGYRDMSHAWNIVKIGEEYYHLDATWNDPEIQGGQEVLRHTYFNVTDAQIGKNHSWDASDYPKCNSTEKSFDNIGIIEYDDDGDAITIIKSSQEFYKTIEECMKKEHTSTSMKILNYNFHEYNISNIINKIVSENRNIYYRGCSCRSYDDKLSGAKYIKIYFK
jgi:transglutaminase-like putative cysteine protease